MFRKDGRPSRRRSLVAGTVAVTLVAVGTAFALGLGVQDPGFENGLGSWVAKVDRPLGNGIPGDNSGKPNRQVVYGPGGSVSAVVPCSGSDKYGICIVTGTDTWTTDGTGQAKHVTPRYGNKMLRIDGPFTNPFQRQQRSHRMAVEQAFTVDAARPVVRLRYKLYTYDSLRSRGSDRFEVQVLDAQGTVVRSKVHETRFDPGEGSDLRATRWLRERIHLGAFAGDDVTIQIAYIGRHDRHGGSWVYVDATDAVPQRTLNVGVGGTGAGSVSGPGINCPGDCTESYPAGQAVALSAAPAAGSTFSGFSGACAGTACNLIMNSRKTVNATFTAGGAAVTPDTTAPTVTELKGPKKSKLTVKSKKAKVNAKFTFGSDDPGAKFECALDKGKFSSCQSPHKVKVGVGKHKLLVRATDAAGNVGATATKSVKVKVKN